jgi:hypothetical protein
MLHHNYDLMGVTLTVKLNGNLGSNFHSLKLVFGVASELFILHSPSDK